MFKIPKFDFSWLPSFGVYKPDPEILTKYQKIADSEIDALNADMEAVFKDFEKVCNDFNKVVKKHLGDKK